LAVNGASVQGHGHPHEVLARAVQRLGHAGGQQRADGGVRAFVQARGDAADRGAECGEAPVDQVGIVEQAEGAELAVVEQVVLVEEVEQGLPGYEGGPAPVAGPRASATS